MPPHKRASWRRLAAAVALAVCVSLATRARPSRRAVALQPELSRRGLDAGAAALLPLGDLPQSMTSSIVIALPVSRDFDWTGLLHRTLHRVRAVGLLREVRFVEIVLALHDCPHDDVAGAVDTAQTLAPLAQVSISDFTADLAGVEAVHRHGEGEMTRDEARRHAVLLLSYSSRDDVRRHQLALDDHVFRWVVAPWRDVLAAFNEDDAVQKAAYAHDVAGRLALHAWWVRAAFARTLVVPGAYFVDYDVDPLDLVHEWPTMAFNAADDSGDSVPTASCKPLCRAAVASRAVAPHLLDVSHRSTAAVLRACLCGDGGGGGEDGVAAKYCGAA